MGHSGRGPIGSSDGPSIEAFPALDLWFDRYAEILGCDNRPGAIAAAIEHLKTEVDRIPEEMARNRREASDAMIARMRHYPVNCGTSSTCWVARQVKTTHEQAANANG